MRNQDRTPGLVWLRRDFRLDDNPALRAAARRRGPVIPVYIHAPEEDGDWAPGSASRWWLHHSLASLADRLEAGGSRLVVRRGPSEETLARLVDETGAGAVYFNRLYEPSARKRDGSVETSLKRASASLEVKSFNGRLLFEPRDVEKKGGGPYRVFTRFWQACLDRPDPARPAPAPRSLATPDRWPASIALETLALRPRIDWAAGFRASWTPGEPGARARLRRFVNRFLADYREDRNRPDRPGSSRLSPHLHFGEISPRRVWWEVRKRLARAPLDDRSAGAFLGEIGWREFANHLLHHFPDTPERPLRPEFNRFPWRKDAIKLAAWKAGRTGVPFVDAGMRELWHTGWMHNRVRMVVGSFLVKNLLIPWQEGARWFWDTLVDADLANNTLGWQWISGSGADAAPYFRIFNPVLQGERFDPDGAYVRRWVPELAALPMRWLHRPWEAPAEVLAAAGVTLGADYPRPVVDHALTRDRALAAYARIRNGAGNPGRRRTTTRSRPNNVVSE